MKNRDNVGRFFMIGTIVLSLILFGIAVHNLTAAPTCYTLGNHKGIKPHGRCLCTCAANRLDHKGRCQRCGHYHEYTTAILTKAVYRALKQSGTSS